MSLVVFPTHRLQCLDSFKNTLLEFLLWHRGLMIQHCFCGGMSLNPSRHSGLRIWCCCNCGTGCSCSLDSIPSLGISMCHRCSQERKKKKTVLVEKPNLHIMCSTNVRFKTQMKVLWVFSKYNQEVQKTFELFMSEECTFMIQCKPRD